MVFALKVSGEVGNASTLICSRNYDFAKLAKLNNFKIVVNKKFLSTW